MKKGWLKRLLDLLLGERCSYCDGAGKHVVQHGATLRCWHCRGTGWV